MYKCLKCGAVLESFSKLKRHYKYHEGIREFKCKYCEKKFVEVFNKDRHERSHYKGEKTWVCEKCGKCYLHKHHLTRHLKNHLIFNIIKIIKPIESN